MTERLVERIVLGTSTLVLVGVGLGGVLAPAAFYASYDIAVAGAVSLSSELRGVGSALVLSGLAIAAGGVWVRWAFPSAIVSAFVLLGFALGRIVSLLVDESRHRRSSRPVPSKWCSAQPPRGSRFAADPAGEARGLGALDRATLIHHRRTRTDVERRQAGPAERRSLVELSGRGHAVVRSRAGANTDLDQDGHEQLCPAT